MGDFLSSELLELALEWPESASDEKSSIFMDAFDSFSLLLSAKSRWGRKSWLGTGGKDGVFKRPESCKVGLELDTEPPGKEEFVSSKTRRRAIRSASSGSFSLPSWKIRFSQRSILTAWFVSIEWTHFYLEDFHQLIPKTSRSTFRKRELLGRFASAVF